MVHIHVQIHSVLTHIAPGPLETILKSLEREDSIFEMKIIHIQKEDPCLGRELLSLFKNGIIHT